MNPQDQKQMKFGLTKDMLAVPDLIRSFDAKRMQAIAKPIADQGRLLMTGEGSSRLFPAKNAIASAKRRGSNLGLHTEAGLQTLEYDLDNWAVMALSNSGRTAEVIELFHRLQRSGHQQRYSLTAFAESPLEALATTGYVCSNAVPRTPWQRPKA
jgi:glucosamine--fructose-6-phosphate aminotransferase (isomerizing)